MKSARLFATLLCLPVGLVLTITINVKGVHMTNGEAAVNLWPYFVALLIVVGAASWLSAGLK